MSTIASYPQAAELDGSEAVAVFQHGKQVQASAEQLFAPSLPLAVDAALAAVAPEVSRAQSWAEASGSPGGPGSKSAKSWSLMSSASAIASSSAAVQSAAFLEQVGLTAATAVAAILATSIRYDTTAQGLAATAEGAEFNTYGAGDTFLTTWRKVNGQAVFKGSLASQAAIDKITRYIPANATNAALSDPSLSGVINAALSDPNVGSVIVGPGNGSLAHAIVGVTGKSLRCRGTRFIRQNNIAASSYFDWACVIVPPGVFNFHASDFTFVAPKLPVGSLQKVQAVWFAGAQFCTAKRIAAYNCGYSFWAQADAKHCTFRDLQSFNANVHFETTSATYILFENMLADDGDGDNPLGVEAVWHCLYGSKNVVFRNGTHRGKGQPFLLVADTGTGEAGRIDLIRFENLRSSMTEGKIGFFASRIDAGATIGRVDMIDCEWDVPEGGLPALFQLGQIYIEGGRVSGRSQENCIAYPEAYLEWNNPRMRIAPADGAFGSFFQGSGNIVVTGFARLESTSALIDIGNIRVRGSVDYSAPGPQGLIYPPLQGLECLRVFSVDQALDSTAIFGSSVVGEGRTQIPLVDGGLYHVQLRGRVKPKAPGDTKQVGVFVDGWGGTLIAGDMVVQTSATAFQRLNVTNGGAAAIYTSESASIDLNVNVRGNGGTMTLGAFGNVILLAGSMFSIRRLA